MRYLKFNELRAKAQKALGKRFDIRRFHAALLASGSLPLTTLERQIDWFIEQEKRDKWIHGGETSAEGMIIPAKK